MTRWSECVAGVTPGRDDSQRGVEPLRANSVQTADWLEEGWFCGTPRKRAEAAAPRYGMGDAQRRRDEEIDSGLATSKTEKALTSIVDQDVTTRGTCCELDYVVPVAESEISGQTCEWGRPILPLLAAVIFSSKAHMEVAVKGVRIESIGG